MPSLKTSTSGRASCDSLSASPAYTASLSEVPPSAWAAVSTRGALTNNGLKLVGFTLGRFLATRSLEQIRRIYADLGQQILDGTLSAPIEKVYGIDEIRPALVHAIEACEPKAAQAVSS